MAATATVFLLLVGVAALFLLDQKILTPGIAFIFSNPALAEPAILVCFIAWYCIGSAVLPNICYNSARKHFASLCAQQENAPNQAEVPKEILLQIIVNQVRGGHLARLSASIAPLILPLHLVGPLSLPASFLLLAFTALSSYHSISQEPFLFPSALDNETFKKFSDIAHQYQQRITPELTNKIFDICHSYLTALRKDIEKIRAKIASFEALLERSQINAQKKTSLTTKITSLRSNLQHPA